MGIRTWHYLLDDDGVPRRLTQKLVADLRQRGGTMPEHASERRKIIIIMLDADGQKPPMLINAVGRYWTFDEQGSLFKQLLQEQKDAVSQFPGALGAPGEPYDEAQDEARRAALRKETIERTVWTPTDDEMEVVIKDIWKMPLSKWRALDLEIPIERH
jgi:hypothetical protein